MASTKNRGPPAVCSTDWLADVFRTKTGITKGRKLPLVRGKKEIRLPLKSTRYMQSVQRP